MYVGVDLSNVEAKQITDLIPPGEYVGTVVHGDVKEGAKGRYINWSWKVEGHDNMVFDIVSLGSEKMLQKQKAMNQCLGFTKPMIEDTEELYGRKCMVKVGISKDKTGEYSDKNKIVSFKKMDNENISDHNLSFLKK